MFKKSSVNKQLGLFSTPSNLMCKRERKLNDDELEWHSQFFRNVTCNIDEEVFRPLYTEKKFGAPTKHIRKLVAMNILKEGAGCSDEQMFENCRYNLLWRKALGLLNLEDEVPPRLPTISSVARYASMSRIASCMQISLRSVSRNSPQLRSRLTRCRDVWFAWTASSSAAISHGTHAIRSSTRRL